MFKRSYLVSRIFLVYTPGIVLNNITGYELSDVPIFLVQISHTFYLYLLFGFPLKEEPTSLYSD